MNSKTSVPVFSVAGAVYYTSDKVSTAMTVNGLILILTSVLLFVLSAYNCDDLYIKCTNILVVLGCVVSACLFVVNCTLRVLAGELMRKAINNS